MNADENLQEMAKVWNVTERTVSALCKSGKIPGAVKKAKAGRFQMMQKDLLMDEFHLEIM